MRQVILDTETTGLEPEHGHRIIEIGCIELVDRRRTNRTFHHYLKPDREVDEGAVQVHGITNEFLSDKPPFSEVVDEFLEFVRGAQLIIHNAPFDVGFLDHEFRLLGLSHGCIADHCTVLDTLVLARQLHPGQRNSLDALCKRYEIDNSHRQWHGALLDAEILADVYLAMTGGQASLSLEGLQPTAAGGEAVGGMRPVRSDRPALRVIRASDSEKQAHAARMDAIENASGGICVWRELENKTN